MPNYYYLPQLIEPILQNDIVIDALAFNESSLIKKLFSVFVSTKVAFFIGLTQLEVHPLAKE